MLNTHSLTRSLAARDGARLVRELERNGLPLGSALAARLAPGWVIPTALGFRRLLEVSHRPSQAARAMLDDLMEAQDAAGGFVDPEGFDGAVVTAAALRALAAARGDRRFAADRDRLDDAMARGVVALRQRQAPDGWFGAVGRAGGSMGGPGDDLGSDSDRRAASVLVYWLVGDEPVLRGALDVASLETAWDGGRDGGRVGAIGATKRDGGGWAHDPKDRDLAVEVRDLWSLARASAGDAASQFRAA